MLSSKLQEYYDGLIRMSNTAFAYNVSAIGEYATGKAEAFEQAAKLIVALADGLSISIIDKKTDIQIFRDQERKQSCQEDAEIQS
jgi:hypothetical protein